MRPAMVLFGVALIASACGGDATESTNDTTTPAVEGTWALSHAELANDCAGEGDLFPFAPGSIRIEQDAGHVTLISEEEPDRSYRASLGGWLRERQGTMQGCTASLVERWTLHGVSQTRLSATFEARVEAIGNCEDLGVSTCTVRHSVWGMRR